MLEYLKTTNVGLAPSLELSLGSRLNVVTGDNGLGKSLLLDIAWWVCSRDWPERPAIPSRFIIPIERRGASSAPDEVKEASIVAITEGRTESKSTQTFYFDPALADWQRDERARPPNPGLVIYARIDGGFSVWDPARHYYRINSSLGIDEPDRPPAFHFTKEEVWSGKRVQDRLKGEVTVCEGLTRDWLEWENREPDLFGVFKAVLDHLSPPGEPIRPASSAVRMPGPDVSSMPALDTPYGVVPLPHTSAAIRRVLSLAYFLVWTWNEHEVQSVLIGSELERRIIIIIDEVEAHLHPKWQRRLLPTLLTVAQHLSRLVRIQLIVSTHSPLVMASLEPDFEESTDRLFHLDLRDGKPWLEHKPWEPHGDASGWLTSDIFQLGEARSQPAEDAIGEALGLIEGDQAMAPEAADVDRIDRALRRHLPSLDPVWAQWTLYKRRLAMEARRG